MPADSVAVNGAAGVDNDLSQDDAGPFYGLSKEEAEYRALRYLEKPVQAPSFLIRAGVFSQEESAKILSQQSQRAKQLEDANMPRDLPPPGYPALVDNPQLGSVEIPLISDVMSSEPVNYHAQLFIGNPPKPFYLDLDSGSTMLWVQSVVNKKDRPIADQSTYYPRKSRTAEDLEQMEKCSYGDGSSVAANLFRDNVGMGSLVAERLIVGAASSSDIKDEFKSDKSNGILGLGFDPQDRRNLVQTLYDQGQVKHASFSLVGPRNDPKLAKEIDRRAILQPRGTFVLGSLDRKFYTGEIAWCPQAKSVSRDRWIVALDRVVINGKQAFEGQYALVDTGTAAIVTSNKVFNRVQSLIPGSQSMPGQGQKMFSFPTESLSSVEFVFNGRSFALQKQDFGLGDLKDNRNRRCSSIMTLDEYPFPDDLWIIGGIFLDNIATIFDYEERKVGFATIDASSADVDLDDLSVRQLVDKVLGERRTDGGQAPPSAPSVPPPSFGIFDTPYEKGPNNNTTISFPTGGGLPGVAAGLCALDMGAWVGPRVKAFADNVGDAEFRVNVNTWGDGSLFAGSAAWFRAPGKHALVETGRVSGSARSTVQPITFTKTFPNPPKVVVWLSGFDLGKDGNYRLKAEASDITRTGFTLKLETWGDTVLTSAEAAWIAFASTVPGLVSGKYSTDDVRPWNKPTLVTTGEAKFDRAFAKPPRVVAAISSIDYAKGKNLRLKMPIQATTTGLTWGLNTWDDSVLYSATAQYLAYPAEEEARTLPSVPLNTGQADAVSGASAAKPADNDASTAAALEALDRKLAQYDARAPLQAAIKANIKAKPKQKARLAKPQPNAKLTSTGLPASFPVPMDPPSLMAWTKSWADLVLKPYVVDSTNQVAYNKWYATLPNDTYRDSLQVLDFDPSDMGYRYGRRMQVKVDARGPKQRSAPKPPKKLKLQPPQPGVKLTYTKLLAEFPPPVQYLRGFKWDRWLAEPLKKYLVDSTNVLAWERWYATLPARAYRSIDDDEIEFDPSDMGYRFPIRMQVKAASTNTKATPKPKPKGPKARMPILPKPPRGVALTRTGKPVHFPPYGWPSKVWDKRGAMIIVHIVVDDTNRAAFRKWYETLPDYSFFRSTINDDDQEFDIDWSNVGYTYPPSMAVKASYRKGPPSDPGKSGAAGIPASLLTAQLDFLRPFGEAVLGKDAWNSVYPSSFRQLKVPNKFARLAEAVDERQPPSDWLVPVKASMQGEEAPQDDDPAGFDAPADEVFDLDVVHKSDEDSADDAFRQLPLNYDRRADAASLIIHDDDDEDDNDVEIGEGAYQVDHNSLEKSPVEDNTYRNGPGTTTRPETKSNPYKAYGLGDEGIVGKDVWGQAMENQALPIRYTRNAEGINQGAGDDVGETDQYAQQRMVYNGNSGPPPWERWPTWPSPRRPAVARPGLKDSGRFPGPSKPVPYIDGDTGVIYQPIGRTEQ
ncbi:MAG: hypothetical protein M1833_001508 [Piccolia ochrophora]|nr:MAG: hypothetical protein M1833_001508 [Piccolia ochrophora]